MMQNINIGDTVIISAEYLSRKGGYPYQYLKVMGIRNGVVMSRYNDREFYFPVQEAIKVKK